MVRGRGMVADVKEEEEKMAPPSCLEMAARRSLAGDDADVEADGGRLSVEDVG